MQHQHNAKHLHFNLAAVFFYILSQHANFLEWGSLRFIFCETGTFCVRSGVINSNLQQKNNIFLQLQTHHFESSVLIPAVWFCLVFSPTFFGSLSVVEFAAD